VSFQYAQRHIQDRQGYRNQVAGSVNRVAYLPVLAAPIWSAQGGPPNLTEQYVISDDGRGWDRPGAEGIADIKGSLPAGFLLMSLPVGRP
jgi:hypothetical protein